MATATATIGAKKETKELTFVWEGRDRSGKTHFIKGLILAQPAPRWGGVTRGGLCRRHL